MKEVNLTPEPRPYDIQEDSTIPASVRGRIAYENYKRAVGVAKALGAVT